MAPMLDKGNGCKDKGQQYLRQRASTPDQLPLRIHEESVPERNDVHSTNQSPYRTTENTTNCATQAVSAALSKCREIKRTQNGLVGIVI